MNTLEIRRGFLAAAYLQKEVLHMAKSCLTLTFTLTRLDAKNNMYRMF